MSYTATAPTSGATDPSTSVSGRTPAAPQAISRTALFALPLVLSLAFGPLAACDTAGPNDTPLTSGEVVNSPHSETEGEPALIEADGSIRAIVEGEEGVEATSAGANRLAVLVAGRATFSHTSVPQLRLNVHQTAGGATSGRGRVTLHSVYTGLDHTTDFTAVCVKPVQGWGRTNYGVTVELDEPYSPYGSIAYSYVALSFTEEYQLERTLVLNTRSFCGGSISFSPPQNVLTGNVQVILPGQ